LGKILPSYSEGKRERESERNRKRCVLFNMLRVPNIFISSATDERKVIIEIWWNYTDRREQKYLEENVLMPHRSPQIPHAQAWYRTRAFYPLCSGSQSFKYRATTPKPLIDVYLGVGHPIDTAKLSQIWPRPLPFTSFPNDNFLIINCDLETKII
jgi:hypothetical protein